MSNYYSHRHDDDDDEDMELHDQLPSVEEYKTTMDAGANKIDPKRIMEKVMLDSDDDGADLDLDGSTVDMPPSDVDLSDVHLPSGDDDEMHDQLPSVDEIYAQNRGTIAAEDRQKFWRRCGYFWLTVLFLTAIIVPPVVLMNQNNYEARREALQQFLQNYATQEQLNDSTSPQHMALEFMARESFDNSRLSDEKRLERYAVASLYYATGGRLWKFQMRWLAPTDVCQWNALFRNTQSGEITQEGVLCENDEGNRVSMLDIPSNNLSGSMPSEIQYLTTLEKIHIEFNPGLSGELPTVMKALTNLWSLELQYCSFTGTVPTWIGEEFPLKRLGLSNNLFTGSVPESLTSKGSLQILALDDNGLAGNIASFSQLTNMQYLYMEDNAIIGELTNDIISKWTDMKELDFSTNSLQGPLPSDLFVKMTNLEILDLHGNNLNGPLPQNIAPNNRITFMSLYDNAISGQIPHNISSMIDLQHLDISRNQLSGTIPTQLGLLSFLRYLFVGSNNYQPQSIPEEILNITTLRELSFKKSNLEGPIPPSIGQLTNLQLLDMDQNRLTGKIPDELGENLSGLDHLMLNRNQLTGSLPDSLAMLKDLNLLLLDHNQLTGSADNLCSNVTLKYFVTDCEALPTNSSGTFEAAEITCPCCTTCCSATNETCNQYDWNVNLDPIWEYGYNRYIYTFTQNLIPEGDETP